MPKLGDYLGQLLSELSMARMQADLESVRIAEIYASHPLLRTMPIPHMRLPNVDIQVPVVIQGSEEPREGESTRGGVPMQRLRERFDDVLKAQLGTHGVELSEANRRQMGILLDETLVERDSPTEAAIGVYQVADSLTQAALAYVGQLGSGRDITLRPEFGSQLKLAARRAFVAERTPPPRLSVLVTTGELREAGGSEVLTHLNLRISEEGLEWTTIESEDGGHDRLVPE